MRSFVATVVGFVFAASATAGELSYTMSPAIENGALHAIDVEMVMTGDSDGETEIELPDQWGGKSELWRGLTEFRVSGEELRLAQGGTPALKVVRHAPGAKLTVRYRVVQAWKGEPAITDSNEYRPVIRPQYFHLIGWSVFARPKWSLATRATFAFKDAPKGWSFASDLEHGNLTLADMLE